jgi:hypothetical protein
VLVLLASGRRRDAVVALGIVAAVVAPSLLAMPYLQSISVSESADGWSGLTGSTVLLKAKLWDLLFFAGPFATILYACRTRLSEVLSEDGRSLRILLLAIVTMAVAYVVIRHPGRNEYKHLLFLSVPAAAVLALCMRELFDRQLAIALAVTTLLLLPGMRALGVRPWFHVLDPCRIDGPYLRLLEPSGDELYQWIATQTPSDSVFIAADLRVPPLGRRPLYIPVSTPWRGRDGWGVTRDQLLEWHVRRPDDVMRRRQRLATMVLDANWMQWTPDKVLAQIRKDIGTRPLFAHIVDPNAAGVLDRTPGFELKFRNRAGSVYAVDG